MAEQAWTPSQGQRDNWVTVAVTALAPGWRIVHRRDDGAVEVHPIPAVLVQELRSTSHLRASMKQNTDTVGTADTQDDYEPPPYVTRVVVARLREGVELTPDNGNTVIGVVGPGEDLAAWFPTGPS